METTTFFEKKINLTPKDINKVKGVSVEDIILEKAKKLIEGKCSENGYVLPGSVALISRSMGYFEAARFTGDAVYYAKLQGKVIYPADGVHVIAEVIRKNKMGLYVNYKDAIRIQVPRDLHLGNEDFEAVQIGDMVEVEIKRSKFQINDDYILASGLFISNQTDRPDNSEETDDAFVPGKSVNKEEEDNNTATEEEFEEEKEQVEMEEGDGDGEEEKGNLQMGGDDSSNDEDESEDEDEEGDDEEDDDE